MILSFLKSSILLPNIYLLFLLTIQYSLLLCLFITYNTITQK